MPDSGPLRPFESTPSAPAAFPRSYSSSGLLDVLTVTDPTLPPPPPPPPHRTGGEGRGSKGEPTRALGREKRERDRDRDRLSERVGAGERKGDERWEKRRPRRGRGREIGGPRGVDALEEGRWGVRERCGSSENVGEGAQRDSGRYRRKVGRGRQGREGIGLTASEREWGMGEVR